MLRPINNFEKRMRFVFGLAFAVLLGTIATSLFVINRLKLSSDWVVHTHQVIAAINDTHIDFGDARVGTKNYLLTHQPRHLAPRVNAFQKIDQKIIELKVLTVDNQQQKANIVEAVEAFREYYQLTSKIIIEVDDYASVSLQKFAEWTDKTEPAGRKVSACLEKMKREEEILLVQREQEATSFVNQAYTIMPFMMAVQLFITTYLYYGVLTNVNTNQ